MKNVYFFIATLIILPFSCTGPVAEEEPEIAEYTVPGTTYEIFVQSFADSDGDGIGDFRGATLKLDYLADLGIEGIWLMPIGPSPSYHKYDVTDYYDIHPDYGTLDDFKIFVQEAHERGIRVFMDLVINHSSDKHPWFISSSTEETGPYRNYYVWADKDSIADQIAKKEISFDSDNITQWHAPQGDTTKLHYYGFFNGGMPDLNYDNPEVREEIFAIGRFWLKEIDVDGFRLDAAKHIYPDDRVEDNTAFWVEFLEEMKKAKPSVYTVGEVWSSAENVSKFVPGFRSLFNFDLAFSILESVNQEKNVAATISGHGWEVMEGKSFIDNLVENRNLFQSKNPEFEDGIFLSNHDQNRFRSYLEGNMDKTKLAASILFTLPGQPYIYYGEEIGMLGKKPDPVIREPFLWDRAEADSLRTEWIEPVHSSDSTVIPLAVQMQNPNSLYHHYKNWIQLRKSHDILKSGHLIPVENDDPEVLIFKRVLERDTLTIYHNLTGRPKNIQGSGDEVIYSTHEGSQVLEGKVKLEGYSSLVVKLANGY